MFSSRGDRAVRIWRAVCRESGEHGGAGRERGVHGAQSGVHRVQGVHSGFVLGLDTLMSAETGIPCDVCSERLHLGVARRRTRVNC